jgi:hypothetical protein
MGELGPFLVPISLFFSIAAVMVLRGPLGKAIGDRLAGRPAANEQLGGPEVEALHSEIDDLQHRLAEVEERLDFTERLLAKHERGRLPPEG